MPDFEALVRHQQTSRKPTTERLKVVEKLPVSAPIPTSDGKNLTTLVLGFIGGLLGSVVVTGLIFYLSAKELIDLKILF